MTKKLDNSKGRPSILIHVTLSLCRIASGFEALSQKITSNTEAKTPVTILDLNEKK